MDLYSVSLATGAVGLGIMAAGGVSHGTHAGHLHGVRGAPTHAGHSGGGAVRIPSNARSHARSASGAGGWKWTSLLSPRVLFSLLVGFGAGGIASRSLGGPFQLGIALASAAIFETLFVGPLWRFLFRFESLPATTLESAIEDEARAVTGFDANGNGLVSVEVDGQVIQLLATLDATERTRGVRIHSGDLLRVAEIDAERGRCTVTLPTR